MNASPLPYTLTEDEFGRCLGMVCPYCLRDVPGWPEAPGCCGEVHAQPCGQDSRLCSGCLQEAERAVQEAESERRKAIWRVQLARCGPEDELLIALSILEFCCKAEVARRMVVQRHERP